MEQKNLNNETQVILYLQLRMREVIEELQDIRKTLAEHGIKHIPRNELGVNSQGIDLKN